MNQHKAKHIRSMIHDAQKDYPNMNRKFAYKEAKRDYLLLPRKMRQLFSIFTS